MHNFSKKTHQEDITRTNIDRHNLNTNCTLSPSINNFSLEIDNLTVDDIHAMEQDIAHGINVVRQKYSNDPNFKGKPLLLKCCKKSDNTTSNTENKDTSNFSGETLLEQQLND